MIGIIKTLMLKELVGYGSTDKAVYPITSTGAVFDSNSTSLDSIIADLYAKIKNAGGSSGSGSGSGSEGGHGDPGEPGKTYDYVPCFIYMHPTDNTVPSKPTGGSYNFNTKTLTPPDGWSSSYSGMAKPIYMSIGIACSKEGSTIEWSAPFIAFSDSTSGGGSDLPYEPTPENDYKTLFIYEHSDEQPDIPTGGSYDFSTQQVTLPDGDWQLTIDDLEKPVYMSIGFCSKNKTDIEWSYPIIVADKDGLGPGGGSDLPYQPVPESNYKTLFIYQHNTSQPDIPTGGSYSFDTQTLNPPDGWYTSKENLTYPVYMSVGFTSKDKNTIEWSYPVIIADKDGLGPGKNPGSALLKRTYVAVIYKQSNEQPNTPSASAGIVHFDTTPYTFDPPTGWSTDTALAVNDDTWCSIKVFYQTADNSYDNSATEWSTPVKANLTKLTLTEAEMDMIAGRISVTSNDVETAFDTWINNTRNLETIAEKVTETTDFYSLTAGQLVTNSDFQLNVAKELITVSNYKDDVVQNASGEIVAEIKADSDGMLTEIAKNVVIEAKADKDNKDGLIALVANKIAETADIYTVTAGQYVVNADFIEQVANKAISASNFKQDVIMDASGKIVAQITADDSGLYSTIANNIVQEAIKDKDNEGGIIYLVAKDVTDNIKSEIEVGTDDSGNGFIKAIANNIDFNSNAFNSIVTNATNGKVTAIMQSDDTIALIKKAANDTATSLIMGDDYIKMVANKVDIVGSLNTTDLTINGGKSRFNADGSGYVANQNINWDKDGNLNLKGNIEVDYFKYNIEELRPTVNNATITLDPIRDKCSMYLIIRNDDTYSALSTAKFMLPDNLKPGTSFRIAATVDSNLLEQGFGALYTFYVGAPDNNWIFGIRLNTSDSSHIYEQAYGATAVELNYYMIYEFTYLGYNIWNLTGDCSTFTDAFNKSNSSK